MGRENRGRPDGLTYRESLEAIGRYFDQQLYRGIFIAEIDEGYIGKAHPAEQQAELQAEGFTFPYDDVRSLVSDRSPMPPVEHGPPHCPYGYGIFMQAVGEMCDRANACYVSVLEVTNGFVLCFTAPTRDGRDMERRRCVLDRLGVEELLGRAG